MQIRLSRTTTPLSVRCSLEVASEFNSLNQILVIDLNYYESVHIDSIVAYIFLKPKVYNMIPAAYLSD
jgi:hypothetical protein